MIFAWLVDKRSAEVVLGGDIYKLEFKPWLTNAQLREQRRLEEITTFWVIAVQVPLDAMFYLESHIRRAIGPVTMTHPPERDRLKPALETNWWSSSHHQILHAAANAERSFTSQRNVEGEVVHTNSRAVLEDKVVEKKRLKRAAHWAEEVTAAHSSMGGVGNHIPDMNFASIYQNPGFMAPPQATQPNVFLAQLFQEMALAQSGGVFPVAQPSGVFPPMAQPSYTCGFQPYQGMQNTLRPTCLFPRGGQGNPQDGFRGDPSTSQTPPGFDRPGSASLGGRIPGSTPGKQRRVDSERQEMQREDSASSTPRSEGSGDRVTMIGTPGMKTTRSRTPTTLSRGQLEIIENRILPIICLAVKENISVIAWSSGDGASDLFSTASPDQPMPTAVTSIIQAAVRGKFLVRLISDIPMGRFILDLANGRKLKFFVPILDARMETTQLAKLEQEGMRLLPLCWFAEGRRQEL
ncbi:hypothetical protein CBR_g38879 [Chara braunii]|uniref:Uncharacterized protein n=1 Tax=Chara braunii TaxID=69332 RepID=A0A388LQJ0_CHABU|nr:hypothetical protein CBR_g38879 [Chara braunii]|eukprot:GBG84596.1 hypothetical protein CBR_g38879 [Chara braunii]